MGKLFYKAMLLIAVVVVGGVTSAQAQGCNELFFSEYVEGSSNNKCLEIYNPTGSPITLTGVYSVSIYSNGSSSAGTTVNLTGTIGAYDVFVLCDDNSATALLDQADQISTASFYNGNDAVALRKSGNNIDVIGQIGFDPVSQWGSGLTSTADNTIRRKFGVSLGDTNGGDAFDPSIEWDGYANDTYDGVGTHSSGCVPATPCAINSIGVAVGECNDNGTPLNASDDYALVSVVINYSNKPSTGILVLSGDVNFSVPVSGIGSNSFPVTNLQTPANGTPIQITATFDADPACTLTNNSMTAPPPCSVIPDCGLPFISEYVEGASNNKCIEIYNPTASMINLATGGYQIKIYFNGSSSAGSTINLTGTIPSGGTYVLCDDSASPDILAAINQLSTANFFNGDDAVELINNQGTLDVIGQIGFDPGSAWTGGGLSTENRTLRRNPGVLKGDNVGTDAFDVTAQWIGYETDNTNNLGYHATSCRPALPGGLASINRNCPGGTSTFNSGSGTFTLTSNCYNPTAHFDDITYTFQEVCGDLDMKVEIPTMTGLGFAGLMIRESAGTGSRYVWLNMRANGQFNWVYRSSTGGAIQFNQSAPQVGKRWLRITRTGNVFKGYVSNNGVNWQLLYQTSFFMNSCSLAGMAVYSNVDGATTSATFRNFMIMSPGFLVAANNDREQEAYSEALERTTSITELSIMPNPAGDYLEVVYPVKADEATLISIYDMNGRRVYNDRLESENTRLDLHAIGLGNGVYMLQIQNGETIQSKRFVKAGL
ncbi:MAG: lamin tail domain-containing protein [Saprospiraceae bacterium]|nr:lamin tail domain-containing protein [Saprospiraceae bacterium]